MPGNLVIVQFVDLDFAFFGVFAGFDSDFTGTICVCVWGRVLGHEFLEFSAFARVREDQFPFLLHECHDAHAEIENLCPYGLFGIGRTGIVLQLPREGGLGEHPRMRISFDCFNASFS